MLTRCLLLLMLASPAFAQDVAYRDERIEVELVCEHARLQAGATAWIGVRFVLQPGWHLYWKNPGDSGLPPRVAWKLPDGYEVSALRWPAPRRIPVPPLMTFGYRGEVLLLAELTVPETAAGTTAKLVAHVAWMTCADLCFQGERELALHLEVADGPPRRDVDSEVPFLHARARLPQPPPRGALEAVRDGDDLRLEVEGAVPAAYFPAGAGEIDYGGPQAREGRRLWLRPADVDAPPARLRGVLTLDRSRHAWIVDVPVQSPPAPEPEPGPSRAFLLGVGLVVALFLIALICYFA